MHAKSFRSPFPSALTVDTAGCKHVHLVRKHCNFKELIARAGGVEWRPPSGAYFNNAIPSHVLTTGENSTTSHKPQRLSLTSITDNINSTLYYSTTHSTHTQHKVNLLPAHQLPGAARALLLRFQHTHRSVIHFSQRVRIGSQQQQQHTMSRILLSIIYDRCDQTAAAAATRQNNNPTTCARYARIRLVQSRCAVVTTRALNSN